ncbi:MAG: type II toxin-antitoxin system VapC family toxin [Acidimicrobiales bacterium]
MPVGAESPDALVDTSVAVALVVADHEQHDAARRAVGSRSVGLAGHAAFETVSVLTRLPVPLRRTPRTVARLIEDNFPCGYFLSSEGAEALWSRLVPWGIKGGAVYDALVGAAAREAQLVLLTADTRALATSRALDARVELVGG